MPLIAQNVRKSLVTLGTLAVLAGLIGAGCSSSDPKATAALPATAADSSPEEAKAKLPIDNSSNDGSEHIATEPTKPPTEISVAIKDNSSLATIQSEIKPDSNGDFSSALLMGNRGVYSNNYWLVVPQTDSYLNCRYTPNGEIRSEIVSGMIVTAKFGDPISTNNSQTPNLTADAIVSHHGKPWLRVTGANSREFFAPTADRRSQDYLGECYVRANSKYIMPVNNDAMN